MTKKVNAEWKQEVVMEIVRVKQIVMERPIQYQDTITSTQEAGRFGVCMCQSFLCKVQKPYVYCLFRNVLILSLQLRRASLAHPFGNQVNQNPRFT